jgi:hypothetical protein
MAPVEEQVEDVINKRGSLTDSVRLKKLKRGSPLRVKRGDLAVYNNVFGSQPFEGIDKLGVIVVEICSVAREEPHFFASFEGKRPIAVELQFVGPIADRKLPDWGAPSLVQRKKSRLARLVSSYWYRRKLEQDREVVKGFRFHGLDGF